LPTDKRRIRKITEDLLTFLKLQDRDLSILFTDNEGIREYNRRYFARDWPTNVISFGYGTGFAGEVLGDLVISLERAREESQESGIPFYERVFALIIHGILHVLGFDHENGANEARRMRYREKKLLNYVLSHVIYKELTL
jgi:probable rRNA maturation factor